MWTWFSFLGFKPRWVSLEVSLTAPYYISVVFYLVRAVVFDTLGPMYTAHKGHVTSFPIVLTL